MEKSDGTEHYIPHNVRFRSTLTHQSWYTNALCKELIDFCRSESLSENGLLEIFEKFGCGPNNNLDIDRYEFFLEACRNGSVTEGIIRCLLEYFPDAATTTSGRYNIGLTPLHVMCFNKNATRGMVQLLVDAFPESLDRAGRIGWTPLHQLSRNESLDDTAAVDMLGLLLERCPEAARHADNSSWLPIHLAVMCSKSFEFCRMLNEAYPRSEWIAASRGPDTRHGLPFHIACRGDNVALAEYFYKLYPESINVVTEHTANENLSGLYPIHFAVIGGLQRTNPAAAVEMVQFLLDCDPNVSSQKFDGNLPLYWACSMVGSNEVNAALKIAQALYDAYPEAIEEEDLSSLNNRFPEEIQAFINTQLTYARQARNTRKMNTPDMNGQLPLHRAFHSGNATLGSIKLLVKGNRDALLVPDNDGALPLHVAIQHNDSPKVVDYLVGLDPNTLTAVDREGNTALHHACRGARHDTISLLLEKYNAVSVSKTNALNKLPIHLLLESGATANREDDTKYLESVFRLLRAYPDTLKMSEDNEQQQSISESSTSHVGKKRKICTD